MPHDRDLWAVNIPSVCEKKTPSRDMIALVDNIPFRLSLNTYIYSIMHGQRTRQPSEKNGASVTR
jgi:hypothetical protein